MLVDREDGACPYCDGQLDITDADDVSLYIDCTECGESLRVEVDHFKDGGVKYWPEAMVEFGEEL